MNVHFQIYSFTQQLVCKLVLAQINFLMIFKSLRFIHAIIYKYPYIIYDYFFLKQNISYQVLRADIFHRRSSNLF